MFSHIEHGIILASSYCIGFSCSEFWQAIKFPSRLGKFHTKVCATQMLGYGCHKLRICLLLSWLHLAMVNDAHETTMEARLHAVIYAEVAWNQNSASSALRDCSASSMARRCNLPEWWSRWSCLWSPCASIIFSPQETEVLATSLAVFYLRQPMKVFTFHPSNFLEIHMSSHTKLISFTLSESHMTMG